MLVDHVEGVVTVILVVAWITLLYFAVARPSGSISASRPRRSFRTPFRFEQRPTPDLTEVGQQLDAVKAASFNKQRLLSPSEYQTFKIIEDDVAAARRGYRVFAQTNLGEVLTTPMNNGFRSIINKDGFRSINSKRVDILIVDRGGWPAVAVEYQGEGHYQGTGAARDAIKKEALRKAGVGYVEVFPNDNAEQIRSRVREHLGWKTAALTIGGLRARRA